MRGSWKTGHVDADLGDDDGGRDIADPGDRGQAQGRLAKGFEPIAELRVNLGYRRIDGIGLGEMDTQQQALVVGHATAQGFDDLRARGSDPGVDLVGEALGIALAPRQGIKDRSAARTHNVRQDRAEFDVCRLQGLVDPLHMRDLFAHQLLAGAGQSLPRRRCCVPKDWRDGARLCQALEMLRQRLLMREEAQLVPVAHRRDPRAGAATPASLAARRAGGPCGPTGASVSRRQPACRKPSKGSAG